MSRKKKVISIIVSVALIAAIGIAATLAYLSDTAGTVENTFTVGNINIELKEAQVDKDGQALTSGATTTAGNAYHLIPGLTVDKNPFVTVVKGSENAYVYIRLSGMDAFLESDSNLSVTGFNNNVWIPIGLDTIDGYDGLYRYAIAIDASATLTDISTVPLFTKITYGMDGTGGDLEVDTISLDAAAIQVYGFDSVDDVDEEAKKLLP